MGSIVQCSNTVSQESHKPTVKQCFIHILDSRLTYINILNQQQYKPLRYSIQLWTFSGGCVSFMCFKASSSSTSPVGVSDLHSTFLFSKLLRRMPVFSNSTRPRRASSTKMQPRRPEDIQSFQNEVYPWKQDCYTRTANIIVHCYLTFKTLKNSTLNR